LCVENDKASFGIGNFASKLFHLAAADQRCGAWR
jgi:hypothetical protein